MFLVWVCFALIAVFFKVNKVDKKNMAVYIRIGQVQFIVLWVAHLTSDPGVASLNPSLANYM